jgi:uncharacterized DUF497 family protein
MDFEWDEEKRNSNLSKHGIDFGDVWRVFEYDIYTIIGDRFDYGEIRLLSLGILFGEIISVSYTEIDAIIRIISAR